MGWQLLISRIPLMRKASNEISLYKPPFIIVACITLSLPKAKPNSRMVKQFIKLFSTTGGLKRDFSLVDPSKACINNFAFFS